MAEKRRFRQPIAIDGTLEVIGATSVTGALTVSGNVTPSGVLVTPANTELSEVVTAASVLTAAESGKTFYLDAVAGFLTTMPAPALGLHYKFVVKTAPTSNGYTIGTPTANIFYGMFVERAGGAGVAGAAQDLITLVANQAIIGDWMFVRSDGTNWYVFGMVNVAAGVTFAVT